MNRPDLAVLAGPHDPARLGSRPDALGSRVDTLTIAVHADIRPLEAEWRALFGRAGSNVYQSFDWIDAWLETAAKAGGIRPAIVTLHDGAALAMILPLGVERIGPLRVARHLGGEHANIRMPLVAPGWRGPADDAATDRLLARIAKAIGGVDLFDFDALPADEHGTPLMLARHGAARPARCNVPVLKLEPDFAAVLAAHRGSRKAKKHRWQINALAPIGGYRLRRAESRSEAEAMFAAFRAEKALWFRRMGIDDSFAAPGIAPFFEALIARRWAEGGSTVIDIEAIEFGGAMHAILGSGCAKGRQSGYFLAVVDDEWRRVSPGELLIHDVVAAACARGTECIDLGRGEERYKASWLDTVESHVRLLRPVTLAGRLAIGGLRLRDMIERRIRGNAQLWRLVQTLRRRGQGQAAGSDSETA